MASSDNLATIEPWMFRTTNTDSWYTDAFARETESALTKALQQSFFSQEQLVPTVSYPDFALNQNEYCSISNTNTTTASASTVTVSGSGSEPETPGSKHRVKKNLGVFSGKNAKRKSRASKRSMTTFIQADPANFRQMVQQVTGVKFDGNGSGEFPVLQLVKPEPVRQPFINKLQGSLPTLDTSAYLLDHQSSNTQQQRLQSLFSQSPAMNLVADDGGAGNDFYSFCSFPTLESSI